MTQRTHRIRRAAVAIALIAAVGLAAAQVPLSGEQLRTWVFGGAPKMSALQPQNILLLVFSSTCTSIPMMGSYVIG